MTVGSCLNRCSQLGRTGCEAQTRSKMASNRLLITELGVAQEESTELDRCQVGYCLWLTLKFGILDRRDFVSPRKAKTLLELFF